MTEIRSVAASDVPPPSSVRTDWAAFVAAIRAAGGDFRSVSAASVYAARTAATRLRGKGSNPLAAPNEFDVRIEGCEVFAALNDGDFTTPEVLDEAPEEAAEPEIVEEINDEPAPIEEGEVYVDLEDLPEDFFEEVE